MPGPDPSTNTSNAVQNRSMMEFEISHRLINRDLSISRIKLNRPSPLPRFHLLSRTFSREIRKLLGFGCPRNERSQGNTYMKSVSYIEGTRVTSLLDSRWKRIVAMARHRRLSVSFEIQAGRPTSVEYYFFSLSLSLFFHHRIFGYTRLRCWLCFERSRNNTAGFPAGDRTVEFSTGERCRRNW